MCKVVLLSHLFVCRSSEKRPRIQGFFCICVCVCASTIKMRCVKLLFLAISSFTKTIGRSSKKRPRIRALFFVCLFVLQQAK